MVSDLRLKRLSEVVKQRAARAILYELKDPRVGFVTVTRVKLARDLTSSVVFWSILGSDADRSKTAHALEDSRGFLQSAIARAMGTRQTPRLTLKYDPAPARAQKVNEILVRLKRERHERGDFDDAPRTEEE